MRNLGSLEIGGAAVLALLAHAAIAVILLWTPAKSGAVAAGEGGLAVSVSLAGGAAADAVDEPPMVEPETAEPEDAPVEEALAEEASLEEAWLDDAAVEEATADDVVQETPVEEKAVEEAPPRETVVATAPRPRRAPARPAARRQEPKPAPRPALQEQPDAEPRPAEQGAAEAPPRQAADDSVAQGQGGSANRADAQARGASGGAPGVRRDYAARIAAWLSQHKRYPRRARSRGIEGVGRLAFEIDPQGRVLAYRLVESTGSKLLDKEILALIERAQPLPAIPPELGLDRMAITIPIRFDLR